MGVIWGVVGWLGGLASGGCESLGLVSSGLLYLGNLPCVEIWCHRWRLISAFGSFVSAWILISSFSTIM